MEAPSSQLLVHISSLLPPGPFQEMEFLDITSIRDTRFGKFAKIPKVGGPRLSMATSAVGLGQESLRGGKPYLWSKGKGYWAAGPP